MGSTKLKANTHTLSVCEQNFVWKTLPDFELDIVWTYIVRTLAYAYEKIFVDKNVATDAKKENQVLFTKILRNLF